MKNMSLIMKEAHKMAKEIKAEFKEVDYKFQLGLCISYLLKEEKKMVELQGSEKQIKWANDIRETIIKEASEMKDRIEERQQEKLLKIGKRLKVWDKQIKRIDELIKEVKNIEKASILIEEYRHLNGYNLRSFVYEASCE